MKKNTKHTPIHTRIHRRVRLALIPHKDNDYRPHVIRRYGILAVVALVVLSQSVYNFSVSHDVLGAETQVTTSGLLNATNDARRADGEQVLALSEKLNEAARRKVEDMFAKQYWAHNSPSGATPWQWFGEVGYAYSEAGENLAKNFRTSGSVISAWLESPSHKANVLKAAYTEVGFAVRDGQLDGKQTSIVVAMYGEPSTGVVQGAVSPTNISSVDPQLSFMARVGLGMQQLNPVATASIIVLLLVANIAFVAHAYRNKLPRALRTSWRRHHALYKGFGFVALALMIVISYGSLGQI
ncbi:MAG: CAP domain-containing protein [Candidatus Saccharimonas sp.]